MSPAIQSFSFSGPRMMRIDNDFVNNYMDQILDDPGFPLSVDPASGLSTGLLLI